MSSPWTPVCPLHLQLLGTGPPGFRAWACSLRVWPRHLDAPAEASAPGAPFSRLFLPALPKEDAAASSAHGQLQHFSSPSRAEWPRLSAPQPPTARAESLADGHAGSHCSLCRPPAPQRAWPRDPHTGSAPASNGCVATIPGCRCAGYWASPGLTWAHLAGAVWGQARGGGRQLDRPSHDTQSPASQCPLNGPRLTLQTSCWPKQANGQGVWAVRNGLLHTLNPQTALAPPPGVHRACPSLLQASAHKLPSGLLEPSASGCYHRTPDATSLQREVCPAQLGGAGTRCPHQPGSEGRGWQHHGKSDVEAKQSAAGPDGPR